MNFKEPRSDVAPWSIWFFNISRSRLKTPRRPSRLSALNGGTTPTGADEFEAIDPSTLQLGVLTSIYIKDV